MSNKVNRLSFAVLLFLLLSPPIFATDWYVDKNATGSNNGTSWANAWESFSLINWGQIQPGDIIYVSGGINSTIYYETLALDGLHGTAAQLITIRNSYEAGHNGRVIIDGQYTRGTGISIGGSALDVCSYLYIKGFEVRNHSESGETAIGGRWQNNVITIDSCLIYGNRHMGIMFIGQADAPYTDDAHAADSITVKNCYLENPEGDSFATQTDLLMFDAATHIFIDNNVLHMKRPDYGVANHCDPLQSIRTEGWRITNNFFIDDSATYTQANILSFWNDTEDGYMDSVIYYNNVFYEGGTWQHPDGTGQGTCLFLRNEGMISGTENAVVVLINNTIVTYGPNYAAINVQSDRVIDYFKNNIVAQFGSGDNNAQQTDYLGFYGAPSPDITYFDNYAGNLYYREWGTESWTTGSGYFQGCGYTSPSGYDIVGVSELNSTFCANDISGDPSFQHDFSYGNHLQASLSAYTMDDWRAGILPQFWMPQNGSSAVDGGEDLQAVVEGMGLEWKDINGNPRDSSPTIGAYQTENGPDLTPPVVTGATLLDSVTLVVNFSEALDQATAENESNYSITNNIIVLNASLSGSKVTLQTSPHSSGSYLVTVVNVEDVAGNSVDPVHNTAQYEYIVIPPDTLMMFPIQNVEGIIIEPDHTPEKTIDGLGAFSGDPDSRWAAEPMPEELTFDLGAIKTVYKTRLSFYNWDAGRVYDYSVSISSDYNNWITIVPQATSASNEEWTVEEFTPVDARYVRVHFINNNQSTWAGLWEGEIWGIDSSTQNDTNTNGLPDKFVLYQNYPNPFNPSTKIKFSVSQESNINLSIYNVLGEMVATLVNEQLKPGYYEYEFNAEQFSSGVYLYKIIAGNFVETKKMVLMK